MYQHAGIRGNLRRKFSTFATFVCVRSFVRSFVRSCVRSFARSFVANRRSTFDFRRSTFDVRCSMLVDGRRHSFIRSLITNCSLFLVSCPPSTPSTQKALHLSIVVCYFIIVWAGWQWHCCLLSDDLDVGILEEGGLDVGTLDFGVLGCRSSNLVQCAIVTSVPSSELYPC